MIAYKVINIVRTINLFEYERKIHTANLKLLINTKKEKILIHTLFGFILIYNGLTINLSNYHRCRLRGGYDFI